MNEKLVDMVFKVGILMVGITFLVVYFLSSQNGRFQKFDSEDILDVPILDTRTGVVHYCVPAGENTPLIFLSLNPLKGKVEIKEIDITGEELLLAPAPKIPKSISADEFLKGKK